MNLIAHAPAPPMPAPPMPAPPMPAPAPHAGMVVPGQPGDRLGVLSLRPEAMVGTTP